MFPFKEESGIMIKFANALLMFAVLSIGPAMAQSKNTSDVKQLNANDCAKITKKYDQTYYVGPELTIGSLTLKDSQVTPYTPAPDDINPYEIITISCFRGKQL